MSHPLLILPLLLTFTSGWAGGKGVEIGQNDISDSDFKSSERAVIAPSQYLVRLISLQPLRPCIDKGKIQLQ